MGFGRPLDFTTLLSQPACLGSWSVRSTDRRGLRAGYEVRGSLDASRAQADIEVARTIESRQRAAPCRTPPPGIGQRPRAIVVRPHRPMARDVAPGWLVLGRDATYGGRHRGQPDIPCTMTWRSRRAAAPAPQRVPQGRERCQSIPQRVAPRPACAPLDLPVTLPACAVL